MRFAFISDIHGNLHALDLVLAELEHAHIDQLICLGDIASLGPQPREVIARLQRLDLPTVMGNHETYLLNPHLTENHHPWLKAMERWCLSLLTPEDLNYLASFRPQLCFKAGNTSLLCFHGSPRSNEEFLHPTAATELLDEVFAGQEARVMIGGHTHIQMVRHHRRFAFLNPGSVGMPFVFPMTGPNQTAIRRAEYAIIDIADDGISFDLHQLPIDFDQLAQASRASGMPDVEFWLSTWPA